MTEAERPPPTPLPTRERQRLDTRKLILEVGLAEIAEVGLSRARIGRIASRAGVTRPTVYAHFPRKEDFLRALELRSREVALKALQMRLAESASGGLIHGLTDAAFDLIEAADPVLRREVFALILREPAEVDWTADPFFGFLTARLRAALEAGEIEADIDAADLTRVLMSSLFGFLVLESEPAEARRRAAHRMLERLLGYSGG